MADPVGWTDVFLGDVRVGDTVRAKAGEVPEDSRYVDMGNGTVVGVRSGAVLVKVEQDTVLFRPNQLERLERPE